MDRGAYTCIICTGEAERAVLPPSNILPLGGEDACLFLLFTWLPDHGCNHHQYHINSIQSPSSARPDRRSHRPVVRFIHFRGGSAGAHGRCVDSAFQERS